MKSFRSRIRSITVIFLGTVASLILWTQSFEVHAGKLQVVANSWSFSKTYETFEKLRKNSGSTRDQWHRVIGSFMDVHQSKQDVNSKRGLLFAGRASLALYKRSSKIEDLDNAVKHLKTFTVIKDTGHYAFIGLRELKKAEHLKALVTARSREEKGLESIGPDPNSPGAQLLNKSQHVSNHNVSSVVTVSSWGAPLPLGSQPELSSGLPKHNHGGNPFYKPLHRSLIGSQDPTRTASLPPATMTDGGSRSLSVASRAKNFVVVIDPGHGGKDPGAVSQDGRTKEKDVTLEIAKRLKIHLEKVMPGTRVMLTRNDDSFLTLSQRTVFANSLNADLFLSIHGNGYGDSRAKGIETFYLSKAVSKASMRVAARENGIPLAKMSDVEATLVDLMVNSKKSESTALANTVHSALVANVLKSDSSAKDRGVKTAPFYVLLGAKMPSILVECAFISNGREQVRLGTLDHLDLIAVGIANGTVKYLKKLDDRG